MEKIKVVYLTGFWYSGATILGRSLKSSEDVIYVGEIRDYWTKGLKNNDECSCGERFESCNFWTKVTQEYINSFPAEDMGKISKALNELEKTKNYFKLKKYIKNKNDDHVGHLLDTYLKHTEKLYEIISKVSGKNIIVDSSRLPGRLLALSLSTKIEIYPIYIIRDPRGVINSLMKKDIRYYDEIRTSTFKHILTWNVKNLLSLDSIKKINSKDTFYLWYKNFTKNPAQVLDKIKKSLNCTLNYEEENGKVSLYLEPGHVFTGNRSRHDTGKITITEDLKWIRELSWSKKIFISITSLPLLMFIINKYKLK
ncbi:MAG: hypothetical protein O6940_07200 [Ignavibacteria bacterium]|nr:hypothetical protein [Ignavibacteria bacterium]